MLKAILADNNKSERLVLKKFLTKFSDIVTVTAEFDNERELVEAVSRLQPQIVFMDIDIPGMNGLEVAMEISDINPQTNIVFLTMQSGVTQEAIDAYAFDYLTKPINFERLEKTIHRICGHTELQLQSSGTAFSVESHSQVLMMKNLSQIMVQTAEKVVLMQTKDIIMVTRNNRKTDICTTTGIVRTNESLERLETILGEQFFRCHKGYIINISRISELVPWGKKTMMVRFLEYEDTALMTNDRFKEFKRKYFLE